MNAVTSLSTARTTQPCTASGLGETAGFYVSVRTGARLAQTALALGPFPTRAAALEQLPAVRDFVAAQHRANDWWSFDTLQLTKPANELPPGTLNALLGLEAAA